MRAISEEKMGRFKVEVELANNNDVVLAQGGHLDPDKVRRVTVQGVVDSGAAYLVLPETVSKQLGLIPTSKVKVRYAIVGQPRVTGFPASICNYSAGTVSSVPSSNQSETQH